jgi:hypothetical protein
MKNGKFCSQTVAVMTTAEHKKSIPRAFNGVDWRDHMKAVLAFESRVKEQCATLVEIALVSAKEANDKNEWKAYVVAQQDVSTEAIAAAAKTLGGYPHYFRVTAPTYSRTVTERAEMSDHMETYNVQARGLLLEPST